MFKELFTGRSEAGGQQSPARSSSSRSKKSNAQRAESESTSASRKPDGERTRRRSEREGSVYDDTASTTSRNATAPSSRSNEPQSRGLTESALRMLPNDEEEWESDELDARSERKSRREGPSESGRRRKHRSEKDRSRSRSRGPKEREERKKGEHRPRDRETDRTRREEPVKRGVGEASRAIPEMGSFAQFPGQYDGGMVGPGPGYHPDTMMSGALPNPSVGQQYPADSPGRPPVETARPPLQPTRGESYGHAAEYYLDQGESVHHQPGKRPLTPNMLSNPDSHLIAAFTVAQPAQDTGNGSAADFYSGKVSPIPLKTAKPSSNGKQPSSSSNKLSKPSRTSSAGAILAAAAGGAAVLGASSAHSASHSLPQSPSTSYQSGGSSRPGKSSDTKPPRYSSTNGNSNASYYGSTPSSKTNGNGPYQDGRPAASSSPRTPSKQSSSSNIPMYAAGAAAAGFAAHEIHQHSQQNMASTGSFVPRPPEPPQPNQSYYAQSSSHGGMAQQQHFHEHKGPMTRLKDGLLSLVSTPEDVAKMEIYTEYIGVCKHCFDPRTSAWDAPRVHHHHRKRDSFEDLRRRRSLDKMRRVGSSDSLRRSGSNRVNKDQRYYASESSRLRREGGKTDVLGAGLAAVGLAAGANALFGDRKDFDDTYSVKSGRREGHSKRQRSRSSSHERRRRSTYGVVRPDGKEEHHSGRSSRGAFVRRRASGRSSRSRSRSQDRKTRSGSGLVGAAGAALGAAAVASSSARRRSRSRDRGNRDDSRYHDISRQDRPEQTGGIFGGFFSPPQKKRRGSREKQQKKSRGFFTFSNSSSSSTHSELAFGEGFASRTSLPLRKKRSARSTRRKSSDEHLAATVAGIGATAAALAAAQRGQRVSKRTSRPDLGARKNVQGHHAAPGHRHGSPGSSEDDGWEDELPSDATDGSSVDGALAFGNSRLSNRQSMESMGSQSSSAGGLGAWGWRWGGKDKKRAGRKPSTQPPSHSSSAADPYTRPSGSTFPSTRPGATVLYDDSGRPLPNASPSLASGPQTPLQFVDPRPVSDAGSLPGSRHASMPGAYNFDESTYVARPGPGPIQQPQPISPRQPAFTQSPPEMDFNQRTRPRRANSSPTRGSLAQDAALIGGAALATTGIIAGLPGRKSKEPANVRFGLTEEQQRREERERREEQKRADEERRKSDRMRALKEEAARTSRESDMRQAREDEIRRAAEAKLAGQRAAQREAEEQAELNRQREVALRERESRENADRERAAAAVEDERRRSREAEQWAESERQRLDRQRREREEEDRKSRAQRAEDDRKQREADERQRLEYQRREREEEERRSRAQRADDERRQREADERSRKDEAREREQKDLKRTAWGSVAGVAAGATAAAVLAGRENGKKQDRGSSDDRRKGSSQRYASDEDGSFNDFTAKEITPPKEKSAPILDDALNDPDFFKKSKPVRSTSHDVYEDLARRATDQVAKDRYSAEDWIADREDAYADKTSQADFFAPDILSSKTDEPKTKGVEGTPKHHADNEIQVYQARDPSITSHFPPSRFDARRTQSRHAPFGVPGMFVSCPTPPPDARISRRSREPAAPSELRKVQTAQDDAKRGESKSSTRSKRSRSISWGEDKTHVYEDVTPEYRDRQSYINSPELRAATATTAEAAISEITVEDASGDKKKYVEEDFRPAEWKSRQNSRNSKNSTSDPEPGPFYRQPFYDSVSDIGTRGFQRDSPGTEGAPPVQGFVEGETEEPTPTEQRTPHIPGGFEDDAYFAAPSNGVDRLAREASKEPETPEAAWEPTKKESKKDKKKREKAPKRSSTFDVDVEPSPAAAAEPAPVPAKQPVELEEGSVPPVAPQDEPADYFMSKKDKKKQDKASKRGVSESDSFSAAPTAPSPERETFRESSPLPAVSYEDPVEEFFMSKKDKKKREKAAKRSATLDDYLSPVAEAPTPEPDAERESILPSTEPQDDLVNEFFTSKKDKKKRDKALKRGVSDVASPLEQPEPESKIAEETPLPEPPAVFEQPRLTKKEQRKLEKEGKSSMFADTAGVVATAGGIAAIAGALESTEDSGSGSSSGKKSKKGKKKLGEPIERDLRDIESPPVPPPEAPEPPTSAHSSMPGAWDADVRAAPDRETPAVDPFQYQVHDESPTSETNGDAWAGFEEPKTSKKGKKSAAKRNSAAWNAPTMSSPLRSEVAYDDYMGDLRSTERTRSAMDHQRENGQQNGGATPGAVLDVDPLEAMAGALEDPQSATNFDVFDQEGPETETPSGMSPDEGRSVASADFESRRASRREDVRRDSEYGEDPSYAYDTQSVATSEPSEYGSSKKTKRRSRQDDDDTASVVSTKSRRDKDESSSTKKGKKGGILGLFSRKSTDTVPSAKDSKSSRDDESEEDRRRRKKKHRDSEYGDDDDDTRSVKSESRHRRHGSRSEAGDGEDDTRSVKSESKHKHRSTERDEDSRERRRHSTRDDDLDARSESGHRHHRRRRTDEEAIGSYADHSFLGMRVEDLPSLPASPPTSPGLAPDNHEQGVGAPVSAESDAEITNRDLPVHGGATGLQMGPVAGREVHHAPAISKQLPSSLDHETQPLPALPVSRPGSPTARPETPLPETPVRPSFTMRPASATTVPLRFPFGHSPSTPSHPRDRTASFTSPVIGSSPTSPISGARKRQTGRPGSMEVREFRPLYLVERNRKTLDVEDTLPSLPSSKPSSRASSVHDSEEYQSAAEYFSSPESRRGRTLSINTDHANAFRDEDDFLDSQENTPKASEFDHTHAERLPRQEPQFYTWEDFAREQQMQDDVPGPSRTASASSEDTHMRVKEAPANLQPSLSPSPDREVLEALSNASRARSESPAKRDRGQLKGIAAAAMLGTAAVYAHQAATRSKDQNSPGRTSTAPLPKQIGPLPAPIEESTDMSPRGSIQEPDFPTTAKMKRTPVDESTGAIATDKPSFPPVQAEAIPDTASQDAGPVELSTPPQKASSKKKKDKKGKKLQFQEDVPSPSESSREPQLAAVDVDGRDSNVFPNVEKRTEPASLANRVPEPAMETSSHTHPGRAEGTMHEAATEERVQANPLLEEGGWGLEARSPSALDSVEDRFASQPQHEEAPKVQAESHGMQHEDAMPEHHIVHDEEEVSPVRAEPKHDAEYFSWADEPTPTQAVESAGSRDLAFQNRERDIGPLAAVGDVPKQAVSGMKELYESAPISAHQPGALLTHNEARPDDEKTEEHGSDSLNPSLGTLVTPSEVDATTEAIESTVIPSTGQSHAFAQPSGVTRKQSKKAKKKQKFTTSQLLDDETTTAASGHPSIDDLATEPLGQPPGSPLSASKTGFESEILPSRSLHEIQQVDSHGGSRQPLPEATAPLPVRFDVSDYNDVAHRTMPGWHDSQADVFQRAMSSASTQPQTNTSLGDSTQHGIPASGARAHEDSEQYQPARPEAGHASVDVKPLADADQNTDIPSASGKKNKKDKKKKAALWSEPDASLEPKSRDEYKPESSRPESSNDPTTETSSRLAEQDEPAAAAGLAAVGLAAASAAALVGTDDATSHASPNKSHEPEDFAPSTSRKKGKKDKKSKKQAFSWSEPDAEPAAVSEATEDAKLLEPAVHSKVSEPSDTIPGEQQERSVDIASGPSPGSGTLQKEAHDADDVDTSTDLPLAKELDGANTSSGVAHPVVDLDEDTSAATVPISRPQSAQGFDEPATGAAEIPEESVPSSSKKAKKDKKKSKRMNVFEEDTCEASLARVEQVTPSQEISSDPPAENGDSIDDWASFSTSGKKKKAKKNKAQDPVLDVEPLLTSDTANLDDKIKAGGPGVTWTPEEPLHEDTQPTETGSEVPVESGRDLPAEDFPSFIPSIKQGKKSKKGKQRTEEVDVAIMPSSFGHTPWSEADAAKQAGPDAPEATTEISEVFATAQSEQVPDLSLVREAPQNDHAGIIGSKLQAHDALRAVVDKYEQAPNQVEETPTEAGPWQPSPVLAEALEPANEAPVDWAFSIKSKKAKKGKKGKAVSETNELRDGASTEEQIAKPTDGESRPTDQPIAESPRTEVAVAADAADTTAMRSHVGTPVFVETGADLPPLPESPQIGPQTGREGNATREAVLDPAQSSSSLHGEGLGAKDLQDAAVSVADTDPKAAGSHDARPTEKREAPEHDLPTIARDDASADVFGDAEAARHGNTASPGRAAGITAAHPTALEDDSRREGEMEVLDSRDGDYSKTEAENVRIATPRLQDEVPLQQLEKSDLDADIATPQVHESPASEYAFSVKKNKGKKKGKKTQFSTTDDWSDAPASREPAGVDSVPSLEAAGAAAALASIGAAAAAEIPTADQDDWSGSTSKKSKKSKKSAKKSGASTPALAQESDHMPPPARSSARSLEDFLDTPIARDAPGDDTEYNIISEYSAPVNRQSRDHAEQESKGEQSSRQGHTRLRGESSSETQEPTFGPLSRSATAELNFIEDYEVAQEVNAERIDIDAATVPLPGSPREEHTWDDNAVVSDTTRGAIANDDWQTQRAHERPHPESSQLHDVDFTATVAAGLAGTGFDPEMVINDPVFQRRASPSGHMAEADPDEVFTTTTSKRKKGKNEKKSGQVSDTPRIPSPVVLLETPGQEAILMNDDFDDTVARSLGGTGFDPALLEKAMSSTNDVSSNDVIEDPEFSFTTTKRKKGKKGKKAMLADEAGGSTQAIDRVDPPTGPPDGLQESDESIPAGAPISMAQEGLFNPHLDPSTLQSASQARGFDDQSTKPAHHEHGNELDLPGGDDVPVEDAGNYFELPKKSTRKGKKTKTAEKKTPGEESADDSTTRRHNMDQGQAELGPPTLQQKAAREKAVIGVPDAVVAETPRTTDVPELSNISGEHESRHDTTGAPPRFPEAHYSRDGGSPVRLHGSSPLGWAAAGIAAAGVGTALLASDQDHNHGPQQQSDAQYQASAEQPSWSFDALQGEEKSKPETSPFGATEHQVIRDSGYQEGTRSVRSSREIPEIRTNSSRDSLRSRRSLEPLRISQSPNTEWDVSAPKTRSENETKLTSQQQARSPSDWTPLDPTSKNRASYLFQSPPANMPTTPGLPESSDLPTPSQGSDASSYFKDNARARGVHRVEETAPIAASGMLSPSPGPLSPRVPLDSIPEEHHASKRSKAVSDVGGPEHIKAINRAETPQAIRAQQRQVSSPATRPAITIPQTMPRAASNPLLTDELINRMSWPAVDEENDTVNMSRSLSRKPAAIMPDHRSPSVMSNRSASSSAQFRSPEDLRSYSRSSNRSATPTLRRIHLSGDLRAASRRGDSASTVGATSSPRTIPFEAPPTPPLNDEDVIDDSASRAAAMNDVFGYGDAQRSHTSPTRPPSVRKRQSMHITDLETRLDQLAAENRALHDARLHDEQSRAAPGYHDEMQEALRTRDLEVQAKEAEINQLRLMLEPLQMQLAQLTDHNNGLSEANRNLVDDSNARYSTLQAEHAHAHEQASRELESVRHEHGRLSSGMRELVEAEIASAVADKNAEIMRLREQLEIAAEQIRALQVQIQSQKTSDFLLVRDEDYFDGTCQKLCQHVQQWVLRFSKMSDNRVCRVSTELNDDKLEARLDNAILDGSDVDKLLGDRIRRRDVFMSIVMTMVWEYIFTRYLFGMDREQRQKLKALEKTLAEVGPPRAVAQWRATTLTLLAKRPGFAQQCTMDTEAVAHEIFGMLCALLPPPSSAEEQLLASLQKVINIAVDLSIEMRTQRAEYIMLPPLQPEYDTNGDLVRKVHFNAQLMNERSGLFSSNEELAAEHTVVKIVLFPLVVKKGDDFGEGEEEEIVVCPAQVLVHNESGRAKKVVRVVSGAMDIDSPVRNRQSRHSLISEAPGSVGF